ncbi:MAG: hypothetical protein HC829_06465 [Bacteroidales bacterium]|nr:hypothetical protein [Bacteroidales bacterium]
MQIRGVPNLNALDYQPQNFRDLFESELGQAIWQFMKRPENLVRMETATFLERAAVEPLAPGLLLEFGAEVAEDRLKQMIGHMARQIMEAMGYEIERPGLRITRESLFSSGARYRKPGEDRDKSMKITREQREAWLRKTAASPFNKWLDNKVKRSDGTLDLDALYAVASEYGIKKRYDHLNPGQQRMTIGIMLRKAIPEQEYADA